MSNVIPIRETAVDLAKIRDLSEQIGRIAYERQILQIGRVAAIGWDLDLPAFVALLESVGLRLSTVDGVQLIHRLAPAPKEAE